MFVYVQRNVHKSSLQDSNLYPLSVRIGILRDKIGVARDTFNFDYPSPFKLSCVCYMSKSTKICQISFQAASSISHRVFAWFPRRK